MQLSNSPVDQQIDISLAVQGFNGRVDFAIKRFGIDEGLMGQMVRLEIAPDNLDVIEFRCVFGQPLDSEPVLARIERRRAILLTWIGPLSSTSTTGIVRRPGLGPKRRSSCSRCAMKSALRLVRLVCTMSLRVT